MADYYPLISRAVAGLEKNSGENRRALYERARAALLAQLRGVTPALNESDITRERLALEESIRKVEAEAARQFVEPSRQPPAPKIRPIEQRPREEPPPAPPAPPSPRGRGAEPRQWDEPDVNAPPPRRYVNPPAPAPQESRAELPPRRPRPGLSDARQSDSIFDQPLPAEPPPAPPAPPSQRHPLRRQATDRRSISDSGLKDFRSVVSEANELGEAPARAEKSAREAYAAMPAPATDLDRAPRAYERSEPRMFESQAPQERMFEQQHEPAPHDNFDEPMLEPSFALEDARPLPPPKTRGRMPPPPSEDEADYEEDAHEEVRPSRSYAGLIKGLVVAAVIAVIAGTLIGLTIWQWPNMVARYRAFTRPAPSDVARDVAAPTTKKVQERAPSEGSQQQSTAAPPTASQPAAAVAQKAVLYEDDPGSKPAVGSAIWRTEVVTPGPGQSPDLAVRATVEVPELRLGMTLVLRRDPAKNSTTSHTIELVFKLPENFAAGGVSNVPGIMLKQGESVRGMALKGASVKVTSGFFLVGLSALESDKEYNLQLLKERAWLDIPLVYDNGRRAILAIEKGTAGERALAEALKAWKQ